MSRFRFPRTFTRRSARIGATIAATALGIGLLGACSAESLTEFGLERVLEAQGEDVDIEFGDGGSFDIESGDGTFSLNFDAEAGTIDFEGDDGSGQVSFDEDGLQFDSDDGSGRISLDENSLRIETEDDGEETAVTWETTDSGSVMRSADGEVRTAQEAPADWPDWIGVPASYVPEASTFSVSTMEGSAGYTAMVTHDVDERYGEQVEARLTAAGFSQISRTTTTENGEESTYATWSSADYVVTVGTGPGTTFVFAAEE